MSRITTIAKLAICLALALSVCAQHEDTVVPESTQDVQPIELVESAAEEAQNAAAHQEANAYLQTAGKDACKSLADAAEKTVQDNVKVQQSMLSKMDNGSKCLQEGQDAVSGMKKALNEAEDKKKKAAKAHDDALNADVDFGKRKFNSLSKGSCGTFFVSQAYKNAEKKVASAKKKMDQAVGKVNEALTSLKTAEAAAKIAVRRCKCGTFVAHEEARAKFTQEIKSSNTKAWTKAAHLKCVLEGKANNKCSVPPLPKVTAVKLAAGIDGSHCSPLHNKEQCGGPAGSRSVTMLYPTKTSIYRFYNMAGQDGYTRKHFGSGYSNGVGCFIYPFVPPPSLRKGVFDLRVRYGYGEYSSQYTQTGALWGLRHMLPGELDHYYPNIDYAMYCPSKSGQISIYEKGAGRGATPCYCNWHDKNSVDTKISIAQDGSVTYWAFQVSQVSQWVKCYTSNVKANAGSYVVDTNLDGGHVRLDYIGLWHNNERYSKLSLSDIVVPTKAGIAELP